MNNSVFKTISYNKALKLKDAGEVVYAVYADGRIVDLTGIDNLKVLVHKVAGASFTYEKKPREKGFQGIHINKDIRFGKKSFNIYMNVDSVKGGEDEDVFDAE